MNPWSQPLDADQLRVFVAFADCGGFSAAAREVHRSQPAVHSQVNKLQDDLGVKLYERVGRGVRLTEAGRAVAAFGRQSLADAAELRARLSGGVAQRVRLLTGAGAFRDLLAPAVARFARAGAPVDVQLAARPEVVRWLTEGRPGVGVTAASEPPAGVWARELCAVGLVLAVPEAYPLRSKAPLALGELVHHPLVLPPAGGPVRSALQAVLRGQSLQVVATCPSWDGALALVAAGAGLALVNDSCGVPDGVRLVPLDTTALPRTRYWVLGPARGPRGVERRLTDHLLHHLQRAARRPSSRRASDTTSRSDGA